MSNNILNPELIKQEAIIIKKYLTSFYDFCKECLGYKDMDEVVHKDLCSFLQYNPMKFKLILMPRYSFKSTICTVGLSLWHLIRNTNLRILIYSDATTKAAGFLSSIKSHIEGKIQGSNFRDNFPNWESDMKSGKWNQDQIVISQRTSAYPEPSVDTGGEGTTKVGFHYDLIIFDDLVSDKNITTKDQMDKMVDCYKKALSLLKPGGTVIMVGTRWHFGDLYGRISAENSIKKNCAIFIIDGEKDPVYGDYCFNKIGLNKEFLDRQKAEQGTYLYSCNPRGTPILMADWSYKNIENINPNDFVVGWDYPGKRHNKSKLKASKVIFKGARVSKVVKIKFKSGRIIRCTPDHNWYVARQVNHNKSKLNFNYMPAKVGYKIAYITDIETYAFKTFQNEKDLSWLSGIFDGEGSCYNGGVIRIAQDKKYNPEICTEIERILKNNGFNFSSNDESIWINGGLRERHRFLKLTKPIRKEKIISSLMNRSDFVYERDEVIEIIPDGEEEVFSFQTETGNYIAWGYGSKNCLYRNNPTDPETAIFKVQDFSFYGSIKPEDLYITCTCDPAGEGEDYTAIVVVGTDNKMDMHILDIINAHLQPSEIVEQIINFQYKYRFQILGIETNFFRGMLEPEIKRRRDEEHRNNPDKFRMFGLHEFEASSKSGGNKFNRIRALQPFHERGALKFPGERFELLQGAYSELAFQMIQFPNSSHDDIMDALAYHINLIRKGGLVKKAELPVNSPAWIEKKMWEKEIEHNMGLPRRLRQQIPDLAFS